uniref:gap junction alpha-5 protein-like n=1 Tax=Lonchura striata TaxID=40157 RepID=UPI001293974B|nr:gap junction alpha-5 protein-like [Lonchura striata domestica]
MSLWILLTVVVTPCPCGHFADPGGHSLSLWSLPVPVPTPQDPADGGGHSLTLVVTPCPRVHPQDPADGGGHSLSLWSLPDPVSTPRILLTVVVIFRILIVAIVGETVYEDEQTMFMCNTLQPGCNQACYDSAFPISHIRYWVFQIILVCTPSLCFITYSVHQAAKQRERRCSCLAPLLEPRPEPPAPRPARSAKAKRQEGISRFYVIQVVFRNALEISHLSLTLTCPLLAQVVFRNALEISDLSPTLTCPLLAQSLGEARRREAAAPALGRTQSSESAYV